MEAEKRSFGEFSIETEKRSIGKLKILLENLLSNSSNKAFDHYFVGEHGIMKDLPVKLNKYEKDEACYWRSKAISIERHIQLNKDAERALIRNKISSIQDEMQKRRLALETIKVDENHNVFNELIPTPSDNHENEQKIELCIDVNSDQLREKCNEYSLRLSLPINENSNKLKTISNDTVYIDNGCNHEQMAQKQSFEIKKELSENELPTDSICANNTSIIISDTTALVPEVMEQMHSLHELQVKQKQLDDWYCSMQRQLEMEKIKLTQRYDELRLKNITQQKKLIESSLRAANQSAIENENNSSTEVLGQMFNNKNKLLKNYISGTEIVGSHGKPMTREGNSFSAKISIQSPYDKCSATPLSTTPQNSQSYVESNKLLQKCSPSVQASLLTKPDQKDIQTSLPGHDSVFVPFHSNEIIAKMLNGENLEELKLRRKSRPIKFFDTPVSEEKGCLPLRDFESCEKSASREDSSKARLTTTSTPFTGEKQPVHDFSPVRRQSATAQDLEKTNLGRKYKQQMEKECSIGNENRYDERIEHAGCIIVAVAKGFLTRNLMKTIKVQEIVKTITDTKEFLDDINKENNNKILNIADRQLRARLLDELSTKRRKLYDVFFNMKSSEQMNLLAITRLQKKDKQLQLAYTQSRPKRDLKEINKKLSVASQRSIRRRQEHQTNFQKIVESRPKTAPGKMDTKKVEKEPKPLLLRPIQSPASPVLSERNRPKATPGDSWKKCYNKKLNMNSERVMAAKLSNRYSSAV